MMNKIGKKVVTFGLCAAMGLSTTALVFAQNENKSTSKQSVDETKKDETNIKDETVYVLTDAEGTVNKIIVSDWLKNSDGSEKLIDESSLENIENIKSDETYSMQENQLIWNADGNDIYYQGTTDKELPVNLKISYQLDGKAISSQELLGKSGHVTIRFDYEDTLYELVKINGKEEKIYVPFLALTGMILDNDCFRNIEVTNGKIINDGNHSVIVAFGAVGVEESLGLEEVLKDLNHFELSADVTGFSFNTTFTYLNNEIFNQLENTQLNSLDDLSSMVDKLSDGLIQLISGSNELYEGLSTLQTKSGELVSGVNELVSGAKKLNDGATEVDNGVAQLISGLSQLSSGLNLMSEKSALLNDGAKTTFNALLSTATEQIKEAGFSIEDLTIENYAAILGQIISSLDEDKVYEQALAKVKEEVENNRSVIVQKVEASVEEQVRTQVKEAVYQSMRETVENKLKEQVKANVVSSVLNMSLEEYNAAIERNEISEETQALIETEVNNNISDEQVETLTKQEMEKETALNLIEENVESKMQSEEVQALIKKNVDYQIQVAIDTAMQSEEVQGQLSAASLGAQKIISLKTSLDSYNTFYVGLKEYTSGVDSASSGVGEILSKSNELKDGTTQLKNGTKELSDGLGTLQAKIPSLIDGIAQLKEGSKQLEDGIDEFGTKILKQLEDIDEDDLAKLAERLDKMQEASNHYQSFSGISDTLSGRVKFIYRTDKIK